MTSRTNRRAVLGSVLAAGAAGAIGSLPAPAAAQAPTLSALDKRVLDLWRRRAKLLAIVNRFVEQNEPENAALNERWDAANAAIGAIEATIEDHIEGSILALAGFMLQVIDDDQRYDIVVEDTLWLPHVVLKAIRAQLADVIAEETDRVLSENEEGARA